MDGTLNLLTRITPGLGPYSVIELYLGESFSTNTAMTCVMYCIVKESLMFMETDRTDT